MRIHFWSSTEYGGFLAGLIRELKARGHEAEQRFTISESSYRNAHSWLERKWLRVNQYILYPLHLVMSLLFGKRADVLVVCTNTFYAPLIATFLHNRVIHLVYDLYPEALVHAGKLPKDAAVTRLIHRLTQVTLDRAAVNVFLGERLRDYVRSTYTLKDDGVVIPVGADDSLFKASHPAPVEGTTILYCGNLGHMHDVETLFGTWQELAARPSVEGSPVPVVTWRFQSSGPRFNELKAKVDAFRQAVGLQISVGPGLDQASWIQTMESAGIALVTMVPGSEEVVMPSKSYSALAAGQAILAVAPESSDLVAMIREHQCGWWVAPGDVAGLVGLVQQIAANPAVLQERRQAAMRAAREVFSQSALAEQWIQVARRISS